MDKDPEAYWFSEAMLYMPFDCENDLLEKIRQAKAGGMETWETFVQEIDYVKSQVMEFVEDNEEARIMAAEMMVDNARTGEFMDPEGEQEVEDNKIDTFEQNEEFDHLDPEYVDKPAENMYEEAFQPIQVRSMSELCKEEKKNGFLSKESS